jgi:hypothetical protein
MPVCPIAFLPRSRCYGICYAWTYCNHFFLIRTVAIWYILNLPRPICSHPLFAFSGFFGCFLQVRSSCITPHILACVRRVKALGFQGFGRLCCLRCYLSPSLTLTRGSCGAVEVPRVPYQIGGSGPKRVSCHTDDVLQSFAGSLQVWAIWWMQRHRATAGRGNSITGT